MFRIAMVMLALLLCSLLPLWLDFEQASYGFAFASETAPVNLSKSAPFQGVGEEEWDLPSSYGGTVRRKDWADCLQMACSRKLNCRKVPPPVVDPPCCTDVLDDVLETMTQFFASKNAKFSIHFGTLLGSQRDGQYIPWTGDVDVAVPEWVLDALQRSDWNDELLKLGYTYFRDGYAEGVGRLCANKKHPRFKSVGKPKRNIDTTSYIRNYAYMDLYLTEPKGNNVATQIFGKNKDCPRSDPSCVSMPKKEFFPLSQCIIRQKYYPCPQKPVKLLERWYGKNYRKPRCDNPTDQHGSTRQCS